MRLVRATDGDYRRGPGGRLRSVTGHVIIARGQVSWPAARPRRPARPVVQRVAGVGEEKPVGEGEELEWLV